MTTMKTKKTKKNKKKQKNKKKRKRKKDITADRWDRNVMPDQWKWLEVHQSETTFILKIVS